MSEIVDSTRAVELLRQLDLATLESMCGRSIVAAVKSVYRSNMESELAKILILKEGAQLLNDKYLRSALVDVLPANQIASFARKKGWHTASAIAHTQKLRKYFQSSYGMNKSEEFVELLDLGVEFIYRAPVDTREAEIRIDIKLGEAQPLRPYLHGYQKRVKDQMYDRLLSQQQRFMVQMPTGAGKTYTALEVVVDLFRLPHSNSYLIWIVDSNELAEQALESFVSLWRIRGDRPLRAFRLFDAFEPDFTSDGEGMVFASFDKFYSILSNHEHAAYQATWNLIRNTRLVIVDEAHTSVAETYEMSISAFLQSDKTKLIGLTATPGRNDPEEFADLQLLYSQSLIGLAEEDGSEVTDPIRYLQTGGYLAELEYETFETQLAFQGKGTRLLEDLSVSEERNKKILDQIDRAATDKQSTLVFACTKPHVYALYVLCQSRAIHAEVITGDTPQATRISILNRFKNREFFILINRDILSAGIDVPNVDRLIITRPIGSKIQYSQILGRALRGPKNGGNKRNTIVGIRTTYSIFPMLN